MQHALTVYDDLDLIGRKVKEPARLDEFESLVHQRGGVDRDLVAHAPVRVIERLLDGDLFQIGFCLAEERPSGGGEDDLLDLAALVALQALEDRRMLAVDRVDRERTLGCGLHDERTARDERFLVCERDRLIRFDRGQRRQQTDHADDGIEQKLGALMLRDLA